MQIHKDLTKATNEFRNSLALKKTNDLKTESVGQNW